MFLVVFSGLAIVFKIALSFSGGLDNIFLKQTGSLLAYGSVVFSYAAGLRMKMACSFFVV